MQKYTDRCDFPFTFERRRALGLIPYVVNRPPEIGLPILPSRNLDAGYGQLCLVNRYALLVGGAAGILFFSIAFHFRNEKDFDLLRYALLTLR